MRARRSRVIGALVVGAVLLAASCGGGDDGDGAAAPRSDECAAEALEGAQAPVEITFWHGVAASNARVVDELVADFNATQAAVRVTAIQQADYQETFLKWRSSASTGGQPDIVQLEETVVQSMVDSGTSVPVGACVDAFDYDTSDFLPVALDYYTTEDTLRAMPWNVSNQVLFYNRKAFAAAGLDPDDPPTTLAEVRDASARLVAAGAAKHGIALKILPYYNEFWFAKAGELYVNNSNGRDERATAANLDTDTGLALWTWWRDMVDAGLAQNVGAGADPDHLFAIGNGNAAMAIDASSLIGPVLDVLGTGQFPNVEIGVGAMPGLDDGGGVPVGDGALWISAASSPAERAAAWRFVEWLVAPEQQARLHVASGYIPIRRSAIDDPAVQALWAEKPMYRVGYDQLAQSERSDATSGSIIGDYQGVRDAVVDGITGMLTAGLSPADALAQAQQAADEAIQRYNARVG